MFSSGDVASHSRGEWAELVEAPGQPRSDVVDTGSNIKTIVYDEPSQIIPLLLGKQVPRKPLLHQRGQQRTAPRLQDPQSVVQAHLAPAPTAIDPESVMAARSTDDCALSTVDGARTSDVYVHLGPLLGLSTNPVDDDARNDHLLDRFSEADILVLSKLPGLCRYFTGRRTSVNAFDHIQHNEDRRIMVAKFQQTSLTLDWTDARKYLLFYRSIVPHAYFAISHIADLAAAEKKAAKESYEVAGASERQTTGTPDLLYACYTTSNRRSSIRHSQEGYSAPEGTGTLFEATREEGHHPASCLCSKDQDTCACDPFREGVLCHRRCPDCACSDSLMEVGHIMYAYHSHNTHTTAHPPMTMTIMYHYTYASRRHATVDLRDRLLVPPE
jgi:hypothetical protein